MAARGARELEDSIPSSDDDDDDPAMDDPEVDDDDEGDGGGMGDGDDVEMDDDEEGEGEDGTATDEDGVLYVSGTGPTLTHSDADGGPSSVREIGHEAVWSLSTAKPGNGVEQVRDGSVDTYWQSDGGQPHLINVQFARRASVSMVAFYLDYNLDESYTPKRMSVKVGMTFHDLTEIRVVELNEPVGWVSIPLRAGPDPLDDHHHHRGNNGNDDDPEKRSGGDGHQAGPVRAHFVQICIVSMHQNGRDTHVRQVKIFGPRNDGHHGASNALLRRTHGGAAAGVGVPEFRTVEMTQFSTVR